MVAYRVKVHKLSKMFDKVELLRFPRHNNSHVDAQDLRVILVEYL